jgi:flagellar biosynthetic protein FliQ
VPTALDSALTALLLALRVALPALLVAWSVSALVGFLQSLTKLTDPAVNTIPRALSVLAVLSLSGAWMAHELAGFAAQILRSLPTLVH